MSHWWRAYEEAVDDPKLCLLSDQQHRAWFNLLCVSSAYGGILPNPQIMAVKLRMPAAKVSKLLGELMQAGLFEKNGNGDVTPHNWKGRQYQSDVSTERVRALRQRRRNVSQDVSETVSETVCSVSVSSNLSCLETPLEVKEVSEEKSTRRKKPKTFLPIDFQPDRNVGRKIGWPEVKIDQEIQRFFDGARAHNRAYADWPAAWRNWCSSPFQTPQSQGLAHVQTDRDVGKSEFKQALRALGDFAEGRTSGSGGEEIVRFLPAAGRRE